MITLMSFKVPTFHDAGEKGDVNEEELSAIDQSNANEVMIKSISAWIFFWFIIALISYLIIGRINPNGNLEEITGYAIFVIAGLLIYTNSVGGSQFMTGGGLVNHKIVMKDYVDSRKRVFTKWMGPSIGILLGVVLVIVSL